MEKELCFIIYLQKSSKKNEKECVQNMEQNKYKVSSASCMKVYVRGFNYIEYCDKKTWNINRFCSYLYFATPVVSKSLCFS